LSGPGNIWEEGVDMKRSYVLTVLVSTMVFLTLPVLYAHAQPTGGGGSPVWGVGERLAQKEDVEEIVQSLRIAKMTEALDLTEEQSVKLFAGLGRMEKEKKDIRRQMHGAITQLRGIVEGGKPTERELSGILEEIKSIRDALDKNEDESIRHIQSVLSLEQQAKYIIFQEDFKRNIKYLLERVRAARAPGEMPGLPGMPGVPPEQVPGFREVPRRFKGQQFPPQPPPEVPSGEE
jgi:Spy/CpxP family protein refolding chaperone